MTIALSFMMVEIDDRAFGLPLRSSQGPVRFITGYEILSAQPWVQAGAYRIGMSSIDSARVDFAWLRHDTARQAGVIQICTKLYLDRVERLEARNLATALQSGMQEIGWAQDASGVWWIDRDSLNTGWVAPQPYQSSVQVVPWQ